MIDDNTNQYVKVCKQAAEALGCEFHPLTCLWTFPKHLEDWLLKNTNQRYGGLSIQIEWMHFHDDYNWAMLLLQKVQENESAYNSFLGDNVIGREWDCFKATPLQITTACLEVLGGE